MKEDLGLLLSKEDMVRRILHVLKTCQEPHTKSRYNIEYHPETKALVVLEANEVRRVVVFRLHLAHCDERTTIGILTERLRDSYIKLRDQAAHIHQLQIEVEEGHTVAQAYADLRV